MTGVPASAVLERAAVDNIIVENQFAGADVLEEFEIETNHDAVIEQEAADGPALWFGHWFFHRSSAGKQFPW